MEEAQEKWRGCVMNGGAGAFGMEAERSEAGMPNRPRGA